MIALPEDWSVSWTAREYLAEAAVAALTIPDLFDGISPPLTGSETLTFAEIARTASFVLEIPVVRKTITHEEYRVDLIFAWFTRIYGGCAGHAVHGLSSS